MYSLKKYYPVKTNDLIRVGRKRDGGYVINERAVNITEILVGLGISIDWSFEKIFKQKNKNIKIFAFDFSVSYKIILHRSKQSFINAFKKKQPVNPEESRNKIKQLLYPLLYLEKAFRFKNFFKHSKNNFFFKNGISNSSHDLFITADEMFSKIFALANAKPNSIFLKIDIEISEYDVLPLLEKYYSYINGMTIEFHQLKKHWTVFENIMQQLMQQFVITHIHGNNFASYIEGTHVPDCIEMTIIKKSLVSNEELHAINKKTYPVKELDYPCCRKKPDIKIGFN